MRISPIAIADHTSARTWAMRINPSHSYLF
jgi:hypothetical protein